MTECLFVKEITQCVDTDERERVLCNEKIDYLEIQLRESQVKYTSITTTRKIYIKLTGSSLTFKNQRHLLGRAVLKNTKLWSPTVKCGHTNRVGNLVSSNFDLVDTILFSISNHWRLPLIFSRRFLSEECSAIKRYVSYKESLY